MTLQICRACLQQGLDYVPLDEGKESYRHKLTVCIPELDVDILKNPVLCDECSIKLSEAYKFRCTCLESEKKINENLTIKINLENAVESNIDFQINNIAINERYVNDRKRHFSDILVNNPNVTVKEEESTENCGEDSCKDKRQKTNDQKLISQLKEIKQEPESGNDYENCKESQDFPLSYVAVKQEQDFFYSEYDVNSKENNNLDLNNQEAEEAKATEIFTEHSYCANMVPNEDVKMEAADSENCLNKIPCTVCKQLYDHVFMPVHMEMHSNVKDVKPLKEEGYLSVKVDTERKFMCRYCNKIFKENIPLYDHINLTHATDLLLESVNKEILCKICNQLFDEKIIKRHFEVHEAEKTEVNADSASQIKLICKVCGEIFAEEQVFTSHYLTHKQGQDITSCTICGETYDQHSARAHMEFHNVVEEIVLNTDIDEATFVSPNSNLNQKYSDQAGTSSTKSSSYTCCNVDFSNLYLLHLHTTSVHGYVCYVCNIKFSNRQALGGHFRVHNEQKSHQCKDCGKYFAQRGNLLRHTHFVHDCIMPYKCDKCEQRFKRNKYLEEHMRSHTQRYICTECDRVFTDVKLLRKHKRYHMPRPHQCDLCNTVFTAKSSLVRHKRDIHKVKVTGRRSYGLGDVVLGSTEANE